MGWKEGLFQWPAGAIISRAGHRWPDICGGVGCHLSYLDSSHTVSLQHVNTFLTV